MDWKERLGTIRVEEANRGIPIFSKQIDDFFLNLGFYIDRMDPSFAKGSYDKLIRGEKVLRYDGNWGNTGVHSIFLNKYEVYVERQDSWGAYNSSSHHVFEHKPLTIEEIELVLDKVIK